MVKGREDMVEGWEDMEGHGQGLKVGHAGAYDDFLQIGEA
jgi:hypothetical protein